MEKWTIDPLLLSSQEYLGNSLIARNSSSKGYSAIIDEYININSKNVEKTFDLVIPNIENLIQGTGLDLGGGVCCISSTLAKKENVEKIYCVELVEDVVKLCHPIVKKQILGNKSDKVISVVGDFNHLNLKDNTVDFAIFWDSIHHSLNPVQTLIECKRVLKKNGILIIFDRSHNDSTTDLEIKRLLNIEYDEEFLVKTYRSKDLILTRKNNGEHEYRYFEWKQFITDAGFELLDSINIKTISDENKKLINDSRIREIFVDYNLGTFGNRKTVFILKPIWHLK
jgi:ubiquinone/menaquinone biosynthesis C-methylase UbiE